MTVDEKEKLNRIITMLCLAYNREPSEPLLAIYLIALHDVDIAALEQSMPRIVGTSKFMPVPAELREAVGGVSAADRPLLAWAAVTRAVRRCGGYQSVDFDDAIINAAIRMMGGWDRFCETPPGDAFDTWLKRDFCQMYAALCRSGVKGEMLEPLPGIVATENWAAGYLKDIPEPVVIETGLPLPPNHRRIEGSTPKRIAKPDAAVTQLAGRLSAERAECVKCE